MAFDRDIDESRQPIPLVIVEGFLGFAGAGLWGNFEEHINLPNSSSSKNRKTIFASVGPVSSLHDRACELFYALLGGTVDYGEEHAMIHGHSRYGRTHNHGLYPQWSIENPLHFLGHSLGGPTITKLQWLMKLGFFGSQYNPDMIRSISTISAPFRGTQLVYLLGERVDSAPSVRPFSIGSILAKSVHILSYFSPFLPSILDMHSDSRSLSMRHSSFMSFVKHLWHSEWAEGRDATPFDVTFGAADEREETMEGLLNPATFYRSYAASITKPHASTASSSNSIYAVPLYLASLAMNSFDFSSIYPTPSFLSENQTTNKHPQNSHSTHDSWYANDGVVPVFSQWHPFSCRDTKCRHHTFDYTNHKALNMDKPEPGIWDVYTLDDTHHVSIAPLWFNTPRQQAFWQDFGRWLRDVDDC
ncbi:alpha/beta-hydrolase [Abortiporus biennis]|nr:alpha/beta-hydrolase [Abortiporus biennis]